MGTKIIKQNSSFGVLRANPRISGNVKITTDSNGEIWLNSMDSNEEMSKKSYKGFKITDGSSYDKDLYNFLNKGKTPSTFVFGVNGEDTEISSSINDVSNTYNSFYNTGVSPLVSDVYSEDYSYLAPFYMGDDIPEYFIIFRVDEPIDYSYAVTPVNLIVGNRYKVYEDDSIDTKSSTYLKTKINHGPYTYYAGDIFTAVAPNYTIIEGSGRIILMDPLYNFPSVNNPGSHFEEKILPKSSIVKSFDLREDSKLGKYLRKIKNSDGYVDSLIDARFEDNQITTYNGVNYEYGVFDQKGEYLVEYYKSPRTQIEFEEYMTDGFKRNGIISYKLLNLEFLFTDDDADNYTLNRYFGLYVSTNDITKFKLDGDSFFLNRNSSGNSPKPTRNDKGYYYQNSSFYQYNKDGIRFFVEPNTIRGKLPTSEVVNVDESNKIFYIRDKFDKIYSLKRSVDYDSINPQYQYSYGLNNTENQLVISSKNIDLSHFTGSNKLTRKQYDSSWSGEKGHSYSVIRIEKELTLNGKDSFLFYHPFGKNISGAEKYDIITCNDLSTIIDEWGPGSYYSKGGTYYFHPLGTNEEIAKALTGLLNSYRYNSFEAFQSGNEVIIRTNSTNKKEDLRYALDFFEDPSNGTRMPESRGGTIYINDKDVSVINRKQYFEGGNMHSSNRIKISIDDFNKINVGQTFIETIKNSSSDSKSGPGYSNLNASIVTGKFRYVDEYARTDEGEIIGLKDFETHATIEIENYNEKISLGGSGRISCFDTYEIPLGVLSIYGIRELDGDFWDSDYGHTPDREYYKYLDVQPSGVTKIIPGNSYFVNDGAVISYEGLSITGPSFFQGSVSESYELITGAENVQSNVFPTISSRGYVAAISTFSDFDKAFYPDIDKFTGFQGINSLKFLDEASLINTKEERIFFGKLNSEYDYTQDNYNKEYAFSSRLVPYISKWVYYGGTDVRGNGYRLNNNLAFTPLNFSPSLDRRIQDPQYFTHEWYQLQKPPYSIPDESLKDDKSYLGGELDYNELTNCSPSDRDYFLDYFSVSGEDLFNLPEYINNDNVKKIPISERYGIFRYNENSGYSEVLFRGGNIRIKRNFKDYTDSESIKFLSNDSFYNQYKFSCVIVPIRAIEDQIQPPIKIKVVENRQFKNVTFVLEVLMDDIRTLNYDDVSPGGQYLDLDYFLLYSMKDKLRKKNLILFPPPVAPYNVEIPAIGDVKLSSGLNVSTSTADGYYSVVNSSTPEGTGVIYIAPSSEYQTDLREELGIVYDSDVSTGIFYQSPPAPPSPPATRVAGSFYGIYQGNSGTADKNGGFLLPFPTGVGENFIGFSDTNIVAVKPEGYNFDFMSLGLSNDIGSVPITTSYNIVENIPVYQRGGGEGYWESILQKISFSNIASWINSGYPYIEYLTYYWDEITKTTKVINDEFALEFLSPSSFKQEKYLIPYLEQDKPSELKVSDIGYNVEEEDGESEMFRFSGGYAPLFRDVLKFSNVKDDYPTWLIPDSSTYYVKILDKNVESSDYNIGSTECFYIDEKQTPEITLVKGRNYIFDLSDSSNLGIKIYFSSSNIGGSFSTDSLQTGYSLVGTPGTAGAKVYYQVPYDLNDCFYVAERVSGTGTVKYMGGNIRIIDSLDYSYCTFGPSKNDFGVVKNVNYYKYSEKWIFKIGEDSSYFPSYNLVSETPLDKRDLSIFNSTWDPGYYRLYSDPSTYIGLPGTKSMTEQKSFFGSKVFKSPQRIASQKQSVYPTSIPDVLNSKIDLYKGYEILWEETNTEIRGIILGDRIIKKYFLEDGAKLTFNRYVIPEFGYGSLSSVDDDFIEYIDKNVLLTYENKLNQGYLKKVSVKDGIDIPAIKSDLPDYQKLINGYYPSTEISYTKVDELRYQFKIVKDPSFDYSVSFSITIGKI